MQHSRNACRDGKSWRNRRGAMLVFAAVSMVALLGSMALVLDTGAGHRQRRIAQTAADAGAIGGAAELFRARFDLVNASAIEEAVRNGFPSSEVTVYYPPATGSRAGNDEFVEVVIARTVPTMFGRFIGRNTLDIRARGVAGLLNNSELCVQTLDPTGARALELNGNIVANCGVAVNSDAPNAVYVHAGKDLEATAVAITGGTEGRGGISPAPELGAAPSPNPLALIDARARAIITAELAGGCDYTPAVVVVGVMTLNPGVYCGGIRVQTNSATAILNPGNYILAGGGLTVSNSGRIQGAGVTIINTNGIGNNAGLYQPYYFGNGCKANLSAPTTGPLAGILIYQDPLAGLPVLPYVNTFACADDYPLDGTIYLPTQTAYFGGSNSGTQINGSVVAFNVEIKEGTTLTMNQPVTSTTALKSISLIE